MAEKKQNVQNAAPKPEKQNPSNVVQITSAKCTAEGCKSKPERAGFCKDHYQWFKDGLITMDGYKAKDFEKKYSQYISKKKSA